MLNDETFDRLIDRYVDGTLAPDEAAEFHALIERNPALQDSIYAERLVRQQLVHEQFSDTALPPSEKLLTFLASTPPRRSNSLIYGFAAAVLLLLLALLLRPTAPSTTTPVAHQVKDSIITTPRVDSLPTPVVQDSPVQPHTKPIAKSTSRQSPEEEIDLDAHLNKPKVYIKDPHIRH